MNPHCAAFRIPRPHHCKACAGRRPSGEPGPLAADFSRVSLMRAVDLVVWEPSLACLSSSKSKQVRWCGDFVSVQYISSTLGEKSTADAFPGMIKDIKVSQVLVFQLPTSSKTALHPIVSRCLTPHRWIGHKLAINWGINHGFPLGNWSTDSGFPALLSVYWCPIPIHSIFCSNMFQHPSSFPSKTQLPPRCIASPSRLQPLFGSRNSNRIWLTMLIPIDSDGFDFFTSRHGSNRRSSVMVKKGRVSLWCSNHRRVIE